MSFFEPPPPAPEPPAQPPRRPWHGAPDAVLGQAVALNLVLGRSEKAALWIPAVLVYPDGFEFEVEIRHRLDDEEVEHPFFRHHWRRRSSGVRDGTLDPSLLRLGIEFSDGSRATNLDERLSFPVAGEPDAPPAGPVLAPSRGGGGGGGRWNHGFWVWPLPPEGPLAFVCEWPVAAISETRKEIDSALIRNAATRAVVLWPEDERRSGSGAGTTYSTMRAVAAPPRPEPPEPLPPDAAS